MRFPKDDNNRDSKFLKGYMSLIHDGVRFPGELKYFTARAS